MNLTSYITPMNDSLSDYFVEFVSKSGIKQLRFQHMCNNTVKNLV